MLRIASVLLVAVLLTTCIISGAFAKYITTANGKDQAQVAKFGVVVNIDDDFNVFDTQYAKEDTQYTGTLAVQSNTSAGDNTDNRVAPGTKDSMSFSITGKPEVAVRVKVTFADDNNAIQLAAGDYTLNAGEYSNAATTVNITETYEPIKFYFYDKAEWDALEVVAGTDEKKVEYTMTLEQLEAAMTAELDKDYEPNSDALANTYYIGWAWAFEDDTNANADFLDTYLAKEATQIEKFGFTVTVTQIN